MTKKIFFFLFISNITFAQSKLSYLVKKGEKIKSTSLFDVESGQICGNNKTGYFVLSSYKNMIEHYDSNMKLVLAKTLNLPPKERWVNLLMVENNIYVFTIEQARDNSLNLQRDNTFKIYKQQLDPNVLTVVPKGNTIGEVSVKSELKLDRFDVLLKTSPDSSKVLVYTINSVDESSKEKIAFKVYNAKMELLWERNITSKYNNNLYDVDDALIDNDGNVYQLAKIYNDTRYEEVEGKPNFTFSIHTFSKNNDDAVKSDLQVSNKFIQELAFIIDKSNQIYCSGLYYEKDKNPKKANRGIYFVQFDPKTKSFINQSTNEATVLFLDNNNNMINEGVMKSNDYFIQSIVNHPNGNGIYLVAEKENENVNSVYDIFVASYDKKGNLEYTSGFKKNQRYDEFGYESFAEMTYKNDLYFFYHNTLNSISTNKNNSFTMIKIDSKGNAQKELVSSFNGEIQLKPTSFFQTSSSEILLFGVQTGFHQLSKIHLTQLSDLN